MIRLSTYSLLAIFALLASGLYLVKYQVQGLKNENARLVRQIDQEKLALELLEAEWVYLNRPGRLQALAAQHLKMQPMKAREIVTFTDIPARPTTVAHLEE